MRVKKLEVITRLPSDKHEDSNMSTTDPETGTLSSTHALGHRAPLTNIVAQRFLCILSTFYFFKSSL